MNKVFLFISVIFLITSCNKDESKVPDYREKFLGTYECMKSGREGCIDSLIYIDTLIQFKITSIDDSLIIVLDEEIKIENNGEFGKDLNSDCIQYPIPDYRVFCGKIENDSIKFSVYQGGLGCFSDYQYYGKKINN